MMLRWTDARVRGDCAACGNRGERNEEKRWDI